MPLKRCRSLDLTADCDEDSDLCDPAFINVDQTRKKGRRGRPPLSQQTVIVANVQDECSSVHLSPSPVPVEECCFCGLTCAVDTSISCDMCNQHYHLNCCGVTPDDAAGMQKLILTLGWNCKACRSDIIRELRSLRAEVNNIRNSERISSNTNVTENMISVDTSDLVVDYNTNTDVASGPRSDGKNINYNQSTEHEVKIPNDSITNYANIVKLVTKTMNITNQRKRNVVVSGMKEFNDWEDSDMFTVFCTEQLDTVPRLSYKNGTRRLGKSTGDKPRKLLIRLESEAAAAELLLKSRNLRYSEDPYVAGNIYFNADQSKEEAKQSFLRRQERRRGTGDTDVSVDARGSTSRNNETTTNRHTGKRSTSAIVTSSLSQLPTVVTSKSVTFTNSLRYGYGSNNLQSSNSNSRNTSNLIVCSGGSLGASTSALLNPYATVYAPPSVPESTTMDTTPAIPSLPCTSIAVDA